jgi:hypothetical protein
MMKQRFPDVSVYVPGYGETIVINKDQ